MKWELTSTPEFINLMSSEIFTGSVENAYLQGDMLYFCDWLIDQLAEVDSSKIKVDYSIKFDIDGSKYDSARLIRFCQYYIRARRDPLNGQCKYEQEFTRIIKENLARIGVRLTDDDMVAQFMDVRASIPHELFKFYSTDSTDQNGDPKAEAIALIITVVHLKNQARIDDVNRITVQIMASTIDQ